MSKIKSLNDFFDISNYFVVGGGEIYSTVINASHTLLLKTVKDHSILFVHNLINIYEPLPFWDVTPPSTFPYFFSLFFKK